MSLLKLLALSAIAALLSSCGTAGTYDTPSFGSGAEPRDATSPTGTITDSDFMR